MPSNKNYLRHKKVREGQKRTMNCGLEAEITKYHGARDIDVRLSDGRVVTGREYKDFLLGCISGYGTGMQSPVDKHIGETRTMNCGLTGTIIEYRSVTDIDIQLSDGRTVTGSYDQFVRGSVSGRGPGYTRLQQVIPHRIGEKRQMRCGLEAEIIAYRSNKDMDVRLSDGRIMQGCVYANFRNGYISGGRKRCR